MDEALTKKDLDLINYQISELGKKIDNLTTNYTSRLDTLDAFQRNADKVFAAKSDQDIVNVTTNTRLTTLEQRWWYLTGAVAVVVLALTLYANYHK